MPSERQQWEAVRPVFFGFGFAKRVENKVELGTPDVNWCAPDQSSGWVELKYVENWPVRGGPLRIDHYTPEQRVWHVTWWRKGGLVHVLLRVADEWFVLPGDWCAQHLGHVARESIVDAAFLHTQGKPTSEALKKALTCRSKPAIKAT